MSPNKLQRFLVVIIFIFTTSVAGYIVFPQDLKPGVHRNALTEINILGQITLGNPNAPAHIIVFEDLLCPHCMEFFITKFDQINEKFIKTGRAKYTAITLSRSIPNSLPPGAMAHCVYKADHQMYIPFMHAYYKKLEELRSQEIKEVSKEQLIELEQLVLKNSLKDAEAFYTDCLKECSVFFETNLDIAQKALNGAPSTPALFIGRDKTPYHPGDLQYLVESKRFKQWNSIDAFEKAIKKIEEGVSQ